MSAATASPPATTFPAESALGALTAERFERALAESAGAPAWWLERKRAAYERFAALPAPRRTDESWRFSSLAGLGLPAVPAAPAAGEAAAPLPGVRLAASLRFANNRLAPGGGLPADLAARGVDPHHARRGRPPPSGPPQGPLHGPAPAPGLGEVRRPAHRLRPRRRVHVPSPGRRTRRPDPARPRGPRRRGLPPHARRRRGEHPGHGHRLFHRLPSPLCASAPTIFTPGTAPSSTYVAVQDWSPRNPLLPAQFDRGAPRRARPVAQRASGRAPGPARIAEPAPGPGRILGDARGHGGRPRPGIRPAHAPGAPGAEHQVGPPVQERAPRRRQDDLLRADHRRSRRPEDRCLPEQPQPGPGRRRGGQLAPRPRDPGQRRAVHPRGDHQPARPGAGVLPSGPGHPAEPGPAAADLRLLRGGAQPPRPTTSCTPRCGS